MNPEFDPLPKRIYRFLSEEIAPYLRARSKKPFRRQVAEMVALYREYGVVPYHYVTHDLYSTSHADEVLDYIPADMLIVFCASLNPSEGVEAALDKAKFSQKMRAAGLHVMDDLCTVRSDGIRLADGSRIDFPQFLRMLEAECQELFFKLRRGACGIAALRLPVGDVAAMGPDGLKKRLFEHPDVSEDAEFLVQRVIVQHPLVASVAPQSVNTVRIDSYVEDGTVHFNTAVLRVGNGEVCTDNWASGGFIVRIDLDSGRLVGNGRTKGKFGKREFPVHPITGTQFDGILVPYWEELKSQVRAAALQMLPLRSIGWDVAITPDGPLLVEANHDYDIFLSQHGGGGYRRRPLGHALMRSLRGSDRQSDRTWRGPAKPGTVELD
ncbi:MAG TPA: sugar-transfer associated ATP-grasp domain-containing protein [Xanthobacteraceae bacterium]|nr:sugar-transfer associated ATP-grasp domain-containing protein [Xanthobacteraceae bacterium]